MTPQNLATRDSSMIRHFIPYTNPRIETRSCQSQQRDGKLKHKLLARKRGFLIYITQTYPLMVPYLKGIHLTLVDWLRPGRDGEGWRIPGWEDLLVELNGLSTLDIVPIVERLMDNLAALIVLIETEKPPLRQI